MLSQNLTNGSKTKGREAWVALLAGQPECLINRVGQYSIYKGYKYSGFVALAYRISMGYLYSFGQPSFIPEMVTTMTVPDNTSPSSVFLCRPWTTHPNLWLSPLCPPFFHCRTASSRTPLSYPASCAPMACPLS
jgi:hypothetical protein